MDPNFFSSQRSLTPLVIPNDPLVSPLYEAMFPFSVSNTTSAIPNGLLTPPIIKPCTSLFVKSHLLSSFTSPPVEPFLSVFGESSFVKPTGYFTSLLSSDLAILPGIGVAKATSQIPLFQAASPPLPSSTTMPHFYHPLGELAPEIVDLQSSTSQTIPPFNPYIDPNPPFLDMIGNSPDSTSTLVVMNPKYKYVCEPCQVYFSTSQAWGGHMSYHSKENRGIPVAPIRTAAAKMTAPASASGRSKRQYRRRLNSKKVNKGKVIGREVLEKLNAINIATKKNQAKKEMVASGREMLKNEVARDAAVLNPPEEVIEADALDCMIDEMWLSDDIDFASLLGN